MRTGAPRLARRQSTDPIQSNAWKWGRRQVFGLKGSEGLPSTYFASFPRLASVLVAGSFPITAAGQCRSGPKASPASRFNPVACGPREPTTARYGVIWSQSTPNVVWNEPWTAEACFTGSVFRRRDRWRYGRGVKPQFDEQLLRAKCSAG